jgi:hypothetical protein
MCTTCESCKQSRVDDRGFSVWYPGFPPESGDPPVSPTCPICNCRVTIWVKYRWWICPVSGFNSPRPEAEGVTRPADKAAECVCRTVLQLTADHALGAVRSRSAATHSSRPRPRGYSGCICNPRIASFSCRPHRAAPLSHSTPERRSALILAALAVSCSATLELQSRRDSLIGTPAQQKRAMGPDADAAGWDPSWVGP